MLHQIWQPWSLHAYAWRSHQYKSSETESGIENRGEFLRATGNMISAGVSNQGDQMSVRKNRPKCSPTDFLSKLIHNYFHGKSCANFWATSVV
jgi:hypothetical protein